MNAMPKMGSRLHADRGPVSKPIDTVIVRIRTVFADRGYDAAANRDTCRLSGAEPRIHKRGRPHGSGLGRRRWPVERSLAWVLENKRLDQRWDRKGGIVEALLRGACIFTALGKLIQEVIAEITAKARA